MKSQGRILRTHIGPMMDLSLDNLDLIMLARTSDGKKVTTATAEFEGVNSIKAIQLFALNCCRHNYTNPFRSRRRFGIPTIVQETLGKDLIQVVTRHIQNTENAFPHHQFSPCIQIVINAVNAADEDCKLKNGYCLADEAQELAIVQGERVELLVEKFNNLARTIRQEILSAGLYERIKSFRRNATERYKHFGAGCEAAVERNSKLLAIRLDTSSRVVDYPRPRIEGIAASEFEKMTNELRNHRMAFTDHLHKTFKDDLEFFAWKIEYGVTRGFHIHWFILLNGSAYQDRVKIPWRLGETWKNDITHGKGTYRNINAQSDPIQSGLRVLKCTDKDIWIHFGRIADYLTKVDYHIKLILPKNMRSFGCSKLRALKTKPGPKRRQELSRVHWMDVRGVHGGLTKSQRTFVETKVG